MGSFHVRKTFPEFIKTELYRALTHSSNYTHGLENASSFLQDLGYADMELLT